MLPTLTLLATAAFHLAGAQSDSDAALVEGDLRLVNRIDINGYATGALQMFAGVAGDGVAVPPPDGAMAPSPDGAMAPSPDGAMAPSPEGGMAPAPVGGGAPSPDGGGAPPPDGGAAPTPDGGVAPTPDGSVMPAPDGGAAPAPDGGTGDGGAPPPDGGTGDGGGYGSDGGPDGGDGTGGYGSLGGAYGSTDYIDVGDGSMDLDGGAGAGRRLQADGGAAAGGEFGAVCAQSFGDAEADVACRQLGFVGGVALRSLGENGRRSDFLSDAFRAEVLEEVAAPFVIGDLGCTGAEERLIDCAPNADPFEEPDYTGYYTYTTTFSRLQLQCKPAFVACGTSTVEPEGAVRLAERVDSDDGNSAAGVLEVFSSGAWGRACAVRPDGRRAGNDADPPLFSQQSAAVVCRQLGFAGGSVEADQERGDYTPSYIDDDTWRTPIVLAGAQCTGSEASLLECPGVNVASSTFTCDLADEVNIVCLNDATAGTDGEVRLEDGAAGADFEFGRLEVFSNGTWGSVCDRPIFTTASAQVACVSLGFDGGAPLRFYQPYENSDRENPVLAGTLAPKLVDVACVGDETSLLDCPARTDARRRCGFATPGKTDATVVACANADNAAGCPAPAEEEGSIRLRGGVGSPCDSMHSGFVEIYHAGEWGTVTFDVETLVADVVCRQIGFPHSNAVQGGFFRSNVTPFPPTSPDAPVSVQWLRNPRCRGPEGALVDCDVGRGFVRRELSVNNDARFRLSQVVCRQFAIEAALESVTTPGAAEGDLRLAEETTTGPWVSGLLEVFFEGTWSQVCGLGFDGFDADVACRQLGFGAGTANTVDRGLLTEIERRALETGGPRGDGVFPVVAVTKVGCVGNESSLLECAADELIDGLRTRECREATEPGLFLSCVANPEPGEEGGLRLVNGTSGDGFATGVLEVFHAGAWGTVCDGRRMPVPIPFERDDIIFPDYYIGISDASADVLCQQLGFDVGAIQLLLEVDRTRPPWVGQLECTGFEEVFTECDDVLFGDTQECVDSQLRLTCSSNDAVERVGEARLVGGRADAADPPAWAYGLMDVHDGFIFGEACLSDREAAVACRSLGFTTGAQLYVAGGAPALPQPPSEVTRITDIECTGTEADLAACDISGRTGRRIDQYQEIRLNQRPQSCAVACSRPSGCDAGSAPPAQGDVRLVPILAQPPPTATCDEMHFGAVEIFNQGQWGRLCTSALQTNQDFFQLDAAVACRQLGFPFATVLPLTSGNTGAGAAAVAWATDVRCTGVEERLDECLFAGAPGSVAEAGLPAAPVAGASCLTRQQERFAVVCRHFEVEGSDFIR